MQVIVYEMFNGLIVNSDVEKSFNAILFSVYPDANMKFIVGKIPIETAEFLLFLLFFLKYVASDSKKSLMSRYFICFLFCFQSVLAQKASFNPMDIKLALQRFNTVGTVLYIAAHPDDENTRLLAYLVREKHLRTCYLSLNRGEGGQNLIGKEQGADLGIIRTNELLQARAIDGAEQYFTRVIDFGYSKSPEETFQFWNHDSVLADVVYLIRKLKPDVIITRFPTTGEGGHGHHTASAILAGEAFKITNSTNDFPSQLKSVNPWQAKTLYWNTFNFGSTNTQRDDQLKTDVGLFNSLIGESYNEIAAKSRSQHKSQGFGVSVNRGSSIEYLKNINGDTLCTSLFCNNDFSWDRINGTERIKTLSEKALTEFDYQHPEKLLPVLFNLYDEVSKLKDDYWRNYKTNELKQLILACSGIWFEGVANNYFVTPGDSLNLKLNIINYRNADVHLTKINYDTFSSKTEDIVLNENKLISTDHTIQIPANCSYSFPYWLKEKPEAGRYQISDPSLIGNPINKAAFSIGFNLKINGKEFEFTTPVRYKWTDPTEGEKYRPVEVTPPASVNFNENVCMMMNGKEQAIKLTVRSLKSDLSGKIKLEVPAGYKVEPSEFSVNRLSRNERITLTATVMLSNNAAIMPAPGLLKVSLDDASTKAYSLHELHYQHIPYQMIFHDAELKLVPVELMTTYKKIGYIEGAGDDVMASLQQMGYQVTLLKEENIKNDDLSKFDVIVTGVRAYNTNEWLNSYRQKLMDFVNGGGNYVVQYNTNNNLGKLGNNIGPYPFKISRNRVTDEHATMTMDIPEHPLLTYPNKITSADFDNWIQERGIYFATDVDKDYSMPLSCHDKGEKPLNGSLITAPYGKGNFTYTGLVFFRELPAGVAGAYRLFANIIEQKKH